MANKMKAKTVAPNPQRHAPEDAGGDEPPPGGRQRREQIAAGAGAWTARAEPAHAAAKQAKQGTNPEGDLKPMVIRTQRVEIIEAGYGDGHGGKQADGRSGPTGQHQENGRAKQESGQRHQQAAGPFEGDRRGTAGRAFQREGKADEAPNGQLRPMDGASAGDVVGPGPAHPEMAGGAEIAREGKPLVGIGIAEEPHGPPRFGGGGQRRGQRGVGFHVPDALVGGPQGAAIPKGQQQNADSGQEAGGCRAMAHLPAMNIQMEAESTAA
jgi:hypothetical protein